MNSLSWSTAFKIAWREARASSGKFLFVVLAVAAGVGALTGVRGFSSAFASMLLREARTLMAADVSVRIFADPSAEQSAAIDKLVRRGARYTRVTETLSMASSTSGTDPVLVSVKAVDPNVFPFYGDLVIDPAVSLREALTSETAAISEDLRLRLKVSPGDAVRIGDASFRVLGVVTQEPDRMSGSLNVGPRLLVSRGGLERTGLMRLGSRAAQRFLFRLPDRGVNVAQVTGDLKQAFPEALVVDFRETNPNIRRGLERATRFLSLVSFIALIIGAIGVGTAMHAHLQQKLDSIAIMKCLGARAAGITRIYLIQTMALGLVGGLLGVALGVLVQALFPALIARYFQLRPDSYFQPLAALQGLIAGLLTTLLFTLPPLLSIRRIRPGLIFRRAMEETKPHWRKRLVAAREAVITGAVILVGLTLVAGWLSGGTVQESAQIGLYFLLALVISLAALAAASALLLRGLRLFVRRAPWKLSTSFRQGVGNLYRPGSQSHTILTALGVGVMFTLTIYLVQKSVLTEIARNAPPQMSNVFLLDITGEQLDSLRSLVAQQEGLEKPVEIMSTVGSRLLAVDGVPIEQMQIGGWARRFRAVRSLTTSAAKPEGAVVTEGKWWEAQGTAEPSVSVTVSAARILRVKPGSVMLWDAFGRRIQARVASVHRMEFERLGSTVDFVVSPGVLDGLPTVYYGAARVKPASVPALQRNVFEQFPTVTVVNVADVIERLQEVVDQIALVIRFISLFAIFAGAIILASSVAGTRYRRIREVVILKTLGATRAHVVRIFSTEFLILGAVAGLLGSLLATGFSALLLWRFFEARLPFDLLPNLTAVGVSALIAAGAGWLASFRILGQKPLEILRSE